MATTALSSSNIAFAFLVLVVVLYEQLAPNTKVEESFNIQAIHDFLYVDSSIDAFDHHSFPGVVPRTFFGSLLIAGVVAPFREWLSPLAAQHACRLVLGSFFLVAVWFAAEGLDSVGPLRRKDEARRSRNKSGPSSLSPSSSAKTWFYLLIASQFHLCFYATRTLPNTFALALVTISLGLLLRHLYEPALAILGAAATVFRCDLFVLIAPLALTLLLSSRISFVKGIIVGLASCVGSLLLTVPIDSFLWKRLVWPEGDVLFFNTVLNKSHEWGTQPFHAYFTSILPRVFLLFYPVVFYASFAVKRMRIFSVSALIFIALYSILPHKELRFVMPVFPLLFAPVAALLPTSLRSIRALGCIFILLIHLYVSFSFAWASTYNYPGSEALEHVHEAARAAQMTTTTPTCPRSIRIFIDDYAAMSGINRFQQLRSEQRLLPTCPSATSFLYEKNPIFFNSSSADGIYGNPTSPFDFIIVRASDRLWHEAKAEYSLIAEVNQLEGVSWRSVPVALKFSEYLLVMKRRERT